MKRILFVLLAMVATLSFVSCDKEDETTGTLMIVSNSRLKSNVTLWISDPQNLDYSIGSLSCERGQTSAKMVLNIGNYVYETNNGNREDSKFLLGKQRKFRYQRIIDDRSINLIETIV